MFAVGAAPVTAVVPAKLGRSKTNSLRRAARSRVVVNVVAPQMPSTSNRCAPLPSPFFTRTVTLASAPRFTSLFQKAKNI